MADLTPADIKAVTDGNNGGYAYHVYPAPMYNYGGYGGFGGGFGMDGSWIWIIALLAMCGGFGMGGFGMGGFGGLGGLGMGGLGGGLIGYGMGMNATKTDLSDGLTALQTSNKIDNVSTQIGNGFANAATQLCGGLADVTAAVTNGTNSINTGMLQGFANTNLANCQNTGTITNAIDNARFAANQSANAIQAQIAQNGYMLDKCCCDIKEQAASNVNTLHTAILNSDNLNYRNTCDIENMIQAQTAAIKADGEATRALINQNRMADLQEKLMLEREKVQNARLDASQAAQTQQIINQLQPVSKPAYITASPYQSIYPFNGFGCCGCNGYNQFMS